MALTHLFDEQVTVSVVTDDVLIRDNGKVYVSLDYTKTRKCPVCEQTPLPKNSRGSSFNNPPRGLEPGASSKF